MSPLRKLLPAVLVLSLSLSEVWASPTGSTAAAKRGASGSSAKSLQIECELMPHLFTAFLQQHYVHKSITDSIKSNTVEQYLKMIDPSKTLLLEKQVEEQRQKLKGLFGQINEGNCTSLTDAHNSVLESVKKTEAFVRNYLSPNYKLNENIELTLDPEKRGHPKSEAEKNQLLEKLIHFQISNYLLTDVSLADAKKQLVHRYELITKRVQEKKTEDIYNEFMESFAGALDPHSSYMSRESLEDFQIHMQLSLEGIGASLGYEDGYTVVREVIPGGSADRSKKIKVKDKIIAVGQANEKPVNVIDMDLKDVVRMIRGKKGTEVNLTILREGEKTERLEIKLVRDKIDLKDQAAKITFEERKVGDRKLKLAIIDFPSFYGGGVKGGRSSYNDIRDLLKKAKAEKVDGVVVDLSRNGGGFLEDSVKIAGLFIKKGLVVSTQSTDGSVDNLADRDSDTLYNGPVVFHTSRFSASASEILAGALKSYGRAVVVGSDHTFGKGSVQVLRGLPGNLGAIKVTTGMYFLPNGESTQHQGVFADVVLPTTATVAEVGEQHLDYSLPPRKIPLTLSDDVNDTHVARRWKPITKDTIAVLNERSKKRVAENTEIQDILKKSAKIAKNQGIVKLADLRKESIAEKKKEKDKTKDKKTAKKPTVDGKPIDGKTEEALDAMTEGDDAQSKPFLKESVNVLVDLITQ